MTLIIREPDNVVYVRLPILARPIKARDELASHKPLTPADQPSARSERKGQGKPQCNGPDGDRTCH